MHTPVRAVIDRAASLLATPLSLLALVVTHDGVAGAYCGDVQPAWREAATLQHRLDDLRRPQDASPVSTLVMNMARDYFERASCSS